MTAKQWTSKIKKMAKHYEVDISGCEPIVKSLAVILEKQDMALEEFERLGGRVCVKHTNKAGASNIVKNPLLVAYMDLDERALKHFRELRLTPASYKKLTGDRVKTDGESPLASVLTLFEDNA